MVDVIYDALDGTNSASIGQGSVRITRTIIVREASGEGQNRAYNAATSSGIPRVGDLHTHLPGVRVDSVSATLIPGTERDYKVTLTYNTEPEGSAGQSDAEVLESGGVIVRFDGTTYTDTTSVDINGNVLLVDVTVSSVGGLSGSTISVTRRYETASIDKTLIRATAEKLFTQHPLDLIDLYSNAVNLTSWSGRPDRTWLCNGASASKYDDTRWKVTFRFSYKPDGWGVKGKIHSSDLEVLNDSGTTIVGYEQTPLSFLVGGTSRNEPGYLGFTYDVYHLIDFNALGFSL